MEESVQSYTLKQLDGTTNEVMAVLLDIAPELESERFTFHQHGKSWWGGRESVQAMLLYDGDPRDNTRFIRIAYTATASGKPEIHQFTMGSLRFYWTPRNEHGARHRRFEIISESDYRLTQPEHGGDA